MQASAIPVSICNTYKCISFFTNKNPKLYSIDINTPINKKIKSVFSPLKESNFLAINIWNNDLTIEYMAIDIPITVKVMPNIFSVK